MATLAFSSLGAAAGGALLPGGVSAFGLGLGGAAIGRAVGALAGAYVDQALLGASGQQSLGRGGRLSDLQVTASTEGAPLPRLYGAARLGGQIIWATRFEEESAAAPGSGKGAGAATAAAGRSYRYFANFAVALCEGPASRIGRCWADGEEIDLSEFTYRFYRGTEDQAPDSLIEAKQGAEGAPAYRGVAYVVFERMPLKKFGNRIPQLNFEVFRLVDDLEPSIRAVTMIPAAGEFAYEPQEVRRDAGGGVTITENRHLRGFDSDILGSLDDLEATLPGCTKVSLFTAWFGDDLRAGNCLVKPRVDSASKSTTPYSWAVAGLTRASADAVSTIDGKAAFGGTPADASVINAIQEMTARGLAVTLTPFLLMDIPAGNTLPDPYRAGSPAGQAVYPWRGRITCSPAPGVAGTVDKTGTAATQLAAFFGTVDAADFSVSGETVTYSGPAEWSYSRFILHNAALAAAAGGVDAFVIGSEMRGLTWVRESASAYPFVGHLQTLAAQVAILLPSAKITYAADWSEWFGHQPADGSGDVYFHLDPLWADANIDAIGIDNYWPLSDWRDGVAHQDYNAGWRSAHDVAYLQANIAGGEGYDWFYSSQANRDAQTRTTISDGAYSKPWVFRFKDIKSWWENEHYNRPAGVESGAPTAWAPESKPFWFMELGCPAVDRGSNQPNVFFDPKSSESFLPHYSRGYRDDGQQRAHLKAMLRWYDEDDADFVEARNPESGVYSGRMVELDRIYVYTWDARPYPAFPNNARAWSDGDNWALGHWLTGRAGGAPLAGAVAAILDDFGFSAYDVGSLTGDMRGYVLERPGNARDAIEPLALAYFFDSCESGDRIRFRHRGWDAPGPIFRQDDLAETAPDRPLFTLSRAQEADLPQAVRLTYIDSGKNFETGSAEARRAASRSDRVSRADLPVVIDYARAGEMAAQWLHESWSARETAAFSLPPSRLALEPGDAFTFVSGDAERLLRVTGVTLGEAMEIEAKSLAPEVYERSPAAPREETVAEPARYGPSVAVFLDLPLIDGSEPPHAGRLAARQTPWPGSVAFYRSPAEDGFQLNTLVDLPATIGETLAPFPTRASGRWDRASQLEIKLYGGALNSADETQVLGGANLAALDAGEGRWELLQFRSVELVAPLSYRLSGLLRGQHGTEHAILDPLPAGARFVLIDEAVIEAGMTVDEIGLPFNWRYGPAPYDLGNAAYRSASVAFNGAGLRPFSPVHLRGRRNGAGDLTISWVRRTRWGGDSWAQAEVPLHEEAEAYEVDVLSAGGTVLRVLSASSPLVVYPASQQIADFGVLQSSVSVRVHQMSASYGRGAAASAAV